MGNEICLDLFPLVVVSNGSDLFVSIDLLEARVELDHIGIPISTVEGVRADNTTPY